MANTKGTPGTPEKSPKWREPFLKALASTGNVLLACRHAKVVRRTAYKHRDRFPNFREKWDEAIEESVDALEGEARRRASSGTDKPVWYKGAQVGTVKEYSDTLLIFLLKANRPEKFRDNYDLNKLINELRSGSNSGAQSPAGGASGG